MDGKHVVGLLQGFLVDLLEVLGGRLAGRGGFRTGLDCLEDLRGGDLDPVLVHAALEVHVQRYDEHPHLLDVFPRDVAG